MAYPDTMKGEGDVLGSIRKVAADEYFDAVEITHIKDEASEHRLNLCCSRAILKSVMERKQDCWLQGWTPMTWWKGETKSREYFDGLPDEAAYLGAAGIAFLAEKVWEEKKAGSYAQLMKHRCASVPVQREKYEHCTGSIFDFDFG